MKKWIETDFWFLYRKEFVNTKYWTIQRFTASGMAGSRKLIHSLPHSLPIVSPWQEWSDLPAPNHSFYLRRFLQPSCLSLVEALYFIPPLRNMLRSQILLDTLELLTFWILKLSRFRQISLAFLAPFSPSSVVHPHLFVYSYLWFLNRCDWFLSVPFFFFLL